MSEKNNMNQISCDMVQDLLPLYQDGLVRDKTKDAVRQHLEQCSACRHVYEQLKMPVALEKNETEQGVERFQAMVKKNREIVKNKIAIACVISAVAACVICFIVLCVPVIPSNESNMRVRDVYCVNEDGVQKVYINCQWPHSRRSAIYRTDYLRNMRDESVCCLCGTGTGCNLSKAFSRNSRTTATSFVVGIIWRSDKLETGGLVDWLAA